MFGGAERDRTVDLYTASVALSQLSYGPTLWGDEQQFNHCSIVVQVLPDLSRSQQQAQPDLTVVFCQLSINHC